MDIEQLFLRFMIYSFLGWFIEVISRYPDEHAFVNRGFLIGPYCPIYGVCAEITIFTLYRIENPIILIILSTLICSIIEYTTSYIMEKIFKARWWDYSQKKLNINGRIYLPYCILFGIMIYFLIKNINPFVTSKILAVSPTISHTLFYILLTTFILDIIVSFNVILKIKKTVKFIKRDNTREMTEKVKEIINKTYLGKRLIDAFPNIKVTFKGIEKRIKSITKF